jgi:multiple sugar transport system substrate-binding protein
MAALTGALAVTLLAACAGGGTPGSGPASSPHAGASVLAGASCKSAKATHLTFWAWVPGMNRAVEAFDKSHPGICVTLENPGAGIDEYTPLNNTLKAGSGAPDVAEVEFAELPSFVLQKAVVDLSKYGANADRAAFVPWAWQQVSRGGAVYAMPSDFGPVAFYYNAPLLDRYKITPPATWADLTDAAAKLHKADPSRYLLNADPSDLQWLLDLMAQAGASPFGYNGGSSITIDWTGPAQMRFANYWQNLISRHLVATDRATMNVTYTKLDNGVVASAIYSAWAPSYFAPNVKKSTGDWRAAPMPQWAKGADVTTDWGGSTYPVFTQSRHPAQAAQFVRWLTASDAAWKIVKTPPSSLFPTYQPLLKSTSFQDLTYPVSGKSHPNRVFAPAADHLAPIQWPPFMPAALSQALTTFGPVLTGKGTLPQAFRNFQNQMVKYAKDQGFKVTTG